MRRLCFVFFYLATRTVRQGTERNWIFSKPESCFLFLFLLPVLCFRAAVSVRASARQITITARASESTAGITHKNKLRSLMQRARTSPLGICSPWVCASLSRKGPHHIVGACVRSLMPAAVWSGPEEDESGCGGSGPGGHGCGAKTKAAEQAAAPAVLHGERSDAWTLRAPGRGTFLRPTLWRADHLQASHSPRASVLQKSACSNEEVYPPVQR